ncbi:MAG: hypothetical protein ABW277_02000 [Longimicrobiaceae bacterium]
MTDRIAKLKLHRDTVRHLTSESPAVQAATYTRPACSGARWCETLDAQ